MSSVLNTYELANDGRLIPVASTEASARSRAGVVRWVRASGLQLDELRVTLRGLGLPEELLEAETLQAADTQPRVAIREGALLVVFPVLAAGRASVLRLRLICTATTLVSEEEETMPAIDGIVAELCATERLPDATPAGLLLETLEAAARGAGSTYLSLRRSLDELAEALEDDSMGVPTEALLTLKRRLGQLATLWEDQGHCFMELQRHRALFLGSQAAQNRLREIAFDGDRGLRLLARMEDRVRDLRQYQLQRLQEATSRRLNLLSVLSSIYLPATLIAGIYGMNFEGIPITQIPYGYFIVIAMMMVVVLAQSWYFYRRGWFN